MISGDKQKSENIYKSIRQLLLQEWDPIGIKDVDEAQDEYDSYALQIHRIFTHNASEEEIFKFLST